MEFKVPVNLYPVSMGIIGPFPSAKILAVIKLTDLSWKGIPMGSNPLISEN
ncbi:MAG: hypothetical protein QF876_13315 [Desulfobacterales bacterium]|jgi:hypothetical protein|nr:hypothetical protein [Desulfobacterales bacterium]MDP6808652.1 hypothetical protein [Desulfobacterales bacterium]|tara:strand:- start:12949 stop:13101 length:153 start_codon:yes stop_codon:yes gene_type:complete